MQVSNVWSPGRGPEIRGRLQTRPASKVAPALAETRTGPKARIRVRTGLTHARKAGARLLPYGV